MCGAPGGMQQPDLIDVNERRKSLLRNPTCESASTVSSVYDCKPASISLYGKHCMDLPSLYAKGMRRTGSVRRGGGVTFSNT